MPNYFFCDLIVKSNISLPELRNAVRDKVDLFFCSESSKAQKNHPWSYHWLSGNERILSYCKDESTHWLRFPELADFQISLNAKVISCYSLTEISEETTRHLLLDQVLPRCLAHQGKIMLHASAVELEQGSILFIGDSGTGKSTLAGNFHQAGNPAISDDCVWVKEDQTSIIAVPSYGGLRLWEDSLEVLFSSEEMTSTMAHYSSKKRIPLSGNHASELGEGLPVLAMIVLSSPEQSSASEVILDRLSPREAFIAMMKQTFQLDLSDLERISQHMQALGRIIPRLPAYRLSMPHDYSLLPLVRQKILETLS